MRRYAITIATIGFFTLAIVGWSSGLSTFDCGLRAAAGAAVLYVLTSLLGKMVLGIVVEAALRGRRSIVSQEKAPGER